MKQNMKKAIGLSLKRYNETYMKEAHNRIDNIVAQSGTDNTEIVDARIDSAGVTHTTLNNRIIAETKMNDQHLVSCSGEHITAENTMGGSITNLEVLGNTIQNEEDLADIKSVGVLQEDGTYKMSILSCGKNLFDGNIQTGWIDSANNFTYTIATSSKSIVCKCKPNTNYVFSVKESYDRSVIGGSSSKIKFGDRLNPITATKKEGKIYFNSDVNSYVAIYFNTTDNIFTDVQLEEGTVATPYEPYQENKCDILLPCQLEKVGDVADRLYYDDVEKAWCVEKNIETLIINGTKQNAYVITGNTDTDFIKIGYKLTEDTYNKYKGFIANIKSILPCESESKFKNNSLNTECITLYNGGNNYAVYLSLSKAKYGDNLESVLNKLEEDSIYLYVVRLTPQKIVLPLSTQITLNSFFGTTHIYMESGEVEGTIKCKIPKSLGATVQSLNNKTDILSDRIEAIEGLKDSQNMKYETDKGYLVCKETKNGVIDDLKLVGKTLIVNDENVEVEAGTEGAKLLSVGQDVDKIEVSSVKSDGNLFDTSSLKGVTINGATGEEAISNDWTCTDFINTKLGETYQFIRGTGATSGGNDGYVYLYLYDVNKRYLGIRPDIGLNLVKYVIIDERVKYFRMAIKYNVNTVNGVAIFKSTEPKPYTPHQSDKKQILFYNENGELEPITELHEWDSIEKHSDNKWYYHKRSGKVVLNGSEDWNYPTGQDGNNTILLYSRISDAKINQNYPICDRFNGTYLNIWESTTDIEGILINHNKDCILRISKSKLSTQDAEGFKQWLQANNVTVVYQLAEEKVYELAPLHLDSYANETLILCNSGAISPKMEFSITSHINELVKAYGERVNLLEEKVYQYMVTQNRMQLASTYSADSVTFKVDYFSLCGDEENYDEDLYNLILNNILVGKDNYNYDKMFTIILDYASWNQISWEQFDILVGLMDIQHNPPIEELPPEDVIEEDIIENETPVE